MFVIARLSIDADLVLGSFSTSTSSLTMQRYQDRSVRKMSDDEWSIQTNLTGVYNVCKAAQHALPRADDRQHGLDFGVIGFYGQASYSCQSRRDRTDKVLSKELAAKTSLSTPCAGVV